MAVVNKFIICRGHLVVGISSIQQEHKEYLIIMRLPPSNSTFYMRKQRLQ